MLLKFHPCLLIRELIFLSLDFGGNLLDPSNVSFFVFGFRSTKLGKPF
jgi:hypothetical protein